MAELEAGWPKMTKMLLTADYELSLFGSESPEQVAVCLALDRPRQV